MAKIALTDLTTNYGSQTLHNNNNATIEDHLNNKVLYRNNPTGEPNTMENQLDMNSNRIINLAQGVLNTDAVTVAQLNALSGSTGTNVSQSRETQLGSAATARAFTLSGITYTLGANTLAVYRNGQRLERTEDYTETSTTVVTLTFDPNPNDRFVFVKNDISTSEVTTTGAISHTLDGTVHTLSDFLGEGIVYEFDTMADAIASTKVYEGAVLLIKDRANSHWDVVLSSGVTENTYSIVQGVGVGTLSFVLRTDGVVNVLALGVTNAGADTSAALVWAFASAYDLYIPEGDYYLDETVYLTGVRKAVWWAPNAKFKWNGSASVPCLSVGNNSTTTNYNILYAPFIVDETTGTTGLVTFDAADRNTVYDLFISANAAKTAGSGVIFKNAATCNTFIKPKANGLNDNFVLQQDSNGNCFYDPLIETYANSAFRFPFNHSSYGVHITGGVIQNDGTGDAILIEHPQDNLTMRDIYFEANDRDIHINHVAGGVSPYVVESCRFKNPTQAESIYLDSPSTVIARGNSFSDANLVNVADASAKYVGEFNESPTSSTEINNSASGSVTRIRQANGSRYTLADGSLAFGSGTEGISAYTEASFTPTVYGASTAGTGTYTSQIGRYTRIGNTVFFRLYIVWTAHTGTGSLRLTLPVASANLGMNQEASVTASDLTYTGQLRAQVRNNEAAISLYEQVSNTTLATTAIDGTGTLWISGQYQVA